MTAFINGNIMTLDENKHAEAFYIKDNKFYAVGSNSYIKSLVKHSEKVIDLKGNTVVPGFNDAHMHFLNYAITKNSVNLHNIESIEEIIYRTKKYINENNIEEGEWIVSRGWNDNLFKEKRLPTRYDLDKISSNHPIFFSRVCGHIGIANSKALEIIQVKTGTPNPTGGIIDNIDGEPTGILRENALNLIFDILPHLKKETIKKLLKTAFKDALKVGLTTIQTEDFSHSRAIKPLIHAYKELEQENNLPLRFILQCNLPDKKSLTEAVSLGLKTGVGTDKFKIGPIKLFQDGSLGGRTAAMIKPYYDADTKGVFIYSQEELNQFAIEAYKAGFQIAVHAIGDAAVQAVLNAYANIYNQSENKDLRNSIVHCQFTNNELLQRFKKIGVIANVQPTFVMSDYPIVEKAVGKTRAEKSYVWKDMINKGINTAFSSDAPIESFNPFEGIYAAVTRKDLNGNPSEGWYSKQCISVEQALKCFTVEPAYINFEENIKGTISEGKLADFIVLSDNIMEIEKEKIKDIRVLETYVGGEKKYSVNT
jgi:predicted amidohydrolase YtcJ